MFDIKLKLDKLNRNYQNSFIFGMCKIGQLFKFDLFRMETNGMELEKLFDDLGRF